MKSRYKRIVERLENLIDSLEEAKAIEDRDLERTRGDIDNLRNLLKKANWKKADVFEQKKYRERGMGDSAQYPLSKEMESVSEGFALYSDGACRGNPGPGAWGCLAQSKDGEILFEASGADNPTTNNKMEIQGGIEVMKRMAEYFEECGIRFSTPVFFYCDSRYVVDGIEKWIPGWKRRGWRKADNKAPENLELWQALDEQCQRFSSLKSLWVKAHVGHPQNERCDQLANWALDELESL